MLRRTEGIVLKTFPFGEADLIVAFLTSSYGLMKVFAKSPRKIRSRFGSSLEPLTCSRVSFWGKEDAALPRLTQADIISSFQTIRDDLRVFLTVSEIVELTHVLIAEKDMNVRPYPLMYKTLCAIREALQEMHEDSARSRTVEANTHGRQRALNAVHVLVSHYKVKFLECAGFAPKLDACGRCGEKGSRFYVSQGAVLCGSCTRGADTPVEIPAGMRKLYEDLLLWDTEKVQRIKPSQSLLAGLAEILSMHVKYILSKPLKTRDFLCSSGKSFQ